MQHSMLQRYSFLFRNRQITLLNKVKTAFFASFLHQNVIFTLLFEASFVSKIARLRHSYGI